MPLDQYKAFHAVVTAGGITRAAEQLFVTQPALTRSIQTLEREMGCPLLCRTPKGVVPTQEGEILYRHLDQALSVIATAESRIRDIGQLEGGEIRIGAGDTLCRHLLVPVLQTFHALHPAVRIHVTCVETPGAAALLRAGKLDLALMNLPFDEDALSIRLLREVQDIFVAGPRFRSFSHVPQSVGEIVKQPMLLLERKSRSRQLLDEYLAKHGFEVEPAFELGSTDLLVRFAQFDFGVACVPRSQVEEMLADGSLVEIRPVEAMPKRHIGAAWLRDMPMTPASKVLVGLLEDTATAEF